MSENEDGRAGIREEDSEATDADNILLKIVEMRARGEDVEAKSNNNAVAIGVGVDNGGQAKEDRGREGTETTPSEKDSSSESHTMPGKKEGTSFDGSEVDSRRGARPGSSPGAYSVEPGRVGLAEGEELPVEASEEPASTVNGPAFDAHLVSEEDTAPRARVRPIRTQQSSDEELGLPTVIEGVKERQEDPRQGKMLVRIGLVCILLLVVIIVVLVLGFTGVIGVDNDHDIDLREEVGPGQAAPDLTGMTTLQRIQATGVLRCADVYFPNGFMYYDDRTGKKTGFYGELCNAIAAALSVEAVFISPSIRGGYLEQLASHNESETVDINIIGYNKNMERVVNGPSDGVQEGLSFSTPMLYGGLKLGGDQFYVTECVDKGMKHIDECADIKVCIDNTTSHYDTFRNLMSTRFFVPSAANGITNYDYLKEGRCNVMVQGMFQASSKNAAEQGVTNYSVSDGFFSKEPMAFVTKSNDPEFSDFVHSILQALLVAEQYNITQETADTFPETDLFGPQYRDVFRKAIGHAGNYGELYRRFLDEYIPRSSLNLLNNGTGLMYSLPWGNLEANRGDRPFGSIMQSVLDRGTLRCGIRVDRPGFAERDAESLVGMEVDLCVALSFALFQGKENAVDFVVLSSTADGFGKLASGEVDVMAGAVWSIVNDVKEPSTGLGFGFSQPYFYGYSKGEDNFNFALATRQEDHDWASFVYWAVNGLIYAEESGIYQNSSISMPEQFLFGENLKRMLRDVVLAVGNYGEIYSRHLELHFPRDGRNLLNKIPRVGPQHYPLPGFFSQTP